MGIGPGRVDGIGVPFSGCLMAGPVFSTLGNGGRGVDDGGLDMAFIHAADPVHSSKQR